ncbi:MAG: hypothetical protein U9N59_16575 [Campylobacterota bacterium]|nr:hypothetical protein [Campylobacterota bacterium]
MFDMFYFQNEVEIDDINKMYYDNFIKHETILYATTNLSKKQLLAFRKKMKDKSFYPIHIIRENKNDTEQMKLQKLQHVQARNEELFKKRYRQVVYEKFGVSSLFDIKHKVNRCPFCKQETMCIDHNYSKEHTDCTLLLKCTSCNHILDTESFFKVIDASYVYSETIHNRLNLYCKNYGNEFIEKKILNELKNTETIGLMTCY